jgi:Flp pilus assembly protein TadG
MRRVRLSSIRRWCAGQGLVETALVLPIIFGLLMTVFQVGELVSDQVQLDHVAYDAALWAQEDVRTATATDIQNHITDELCGNGLSYPTSTAPSKFCRSGSLSVSVTAKDASSTRLPFVTDAEAATCRPWTLTVSPAATTVPQGTSVTFTVTVVQGSGGGQVPTVTLSLSGTPPGVTPSFPVYTPATASAGSSATVTFSPSSITPPASYTLGFGGRDQCNQPSGAGPLATATLTVSGPAPPSGCASPVVRVKKAFQVIDPSVTSAMTIDGKNFASGALVSFGGTQASLVSVISATEISVTLPLLPPGIYNITVTNPGNCATTLRNAVTICNAGTCTSTSSGIITTGNPCANPLSGSVESQIVVRWTETLVIPWVSSGITLVATHNAICQ